MSDQSFSNRFIMQLRNSRRSRMNAAFPAGTWLLPSKGRFVTIRGAWLAWMISALLAVSSATGLSQSNGIYREIFTSLAGSTLQNLTNNPNFPNFPSSAEIATNNFEGPYLYGDLYGDRYRALLIPPVTGSYVFWVQGQNAAALSVSSDESPINKTQIAVSALTSFYREWYRYTSQQSTGVVLQAGRRYYIEGLHSAGNGNDSFAVGWKLPNGVLEQPIPASRCIPFGLPAVSRPALTSQPVNAAALENAPAIFRVGISNLDVVVCQWQRNGTNLPPTFGATYTLSAATTNDHGASFRCVLSNSFGTVTSAVAVLSVVTDATRPAVLSAANIDFNSVLVTFTEPVEPATATTATNYAINNGATIASVRAGPSAREVVLLTSPLARGTSYTVTVNNVRDQAAARNTVLANSQQSFPALLKGIYREVYTNIAGSLLLDLTNSPTFPNGAASAELVTNLFETGDYPLNNYGQRLRATIIPPLTGNYAFWVSAHDSAILSLGTNDQPSSARTIATVSAATLVCAREWEVQPNQRSAPITLTAGQQYYLEAITKGGLSSSYPQDHLAVRWQLPDGSLEEPIQTARLTPVGNTLPVILAPPGSLGVMEGAPATFAVTIGNLDPLTCRWQQNGVDIPEATNLSYTLPAVSMTNNGNTFRCILSNPVGTVISANALLTVTPDNVRPLLVNVANTSSNRVVVYFSEAVDPATATNVANYAIPGLTLSGPALSGDGRSVTLTNTPMAYGSNYTITVNRVRDRAATYNVIATNSQWTFAASAFFLQGIGGATPGSMVQTNGGLDLTAGNGDFYGTSDAFSFAWQQRSGDFDVKVRVARLDFADSWSVAGLMVREDLNTTNRYAAVFSTPSVAGTFFQARTNPAVVPLTSGTFPVNYPYTWLRLQRIGGTSFRGYASYDGGIWTQLGAVTLPLSTKVFVGLTLSSKVPSQNVTAQFRDFQDNVSTAIGSPLVTVEPPGPSSRRTPLTFSELMYHPATRTDGRKLEFIEIFNSNPFFEDLSGYRISGQIEYTFPAGTVLGGGGFLVVARNPADIQAVYGITNVTGPYIGTFSNKKGTLRLRNRSSAILLEVNYDSRSPWPTSADGVGHSLVMARPSYGEGNGYAWSQSDAIGGSPGTMDGIGGEPARNVVINEFLAHTDLPDLDYIELYNHGTNAVNLSGYWLSDDPATNKFRIPNGTVIGPTGFVFYSETTLGFSLSAGGETIFLLNSNQTRVVDAVPFDGQENGVATGRSPDGGPRFYRLAARSPGSSNSAPRAATLVINEIMYAPISEDDNDEFVEIHNRGTNAVNLTNWRFTEGIDFTFPTNLVIATNAYVVVARNVARLLTNYPGLTTNNTVGNYTGTLANGGERIALSMPDTVVTTNVPGGVKTNLIHIVVNEVTYGTGGKWGKWSDGGGSSLELIDPRSDNRLPSNWADSDDTVKSPWTTVTATGLLDNNPEGSGRFDMLQVSMIDEGECLVDNVNVTFPSLYGSVNLVTNSGFENGFTGWVPQGAMRTSFIDTPGYPNTNATGHSLHVVAKERGDTGANRIYTLLNNSYESNITGTISAQVRWLHGNREVLLRLRGNLLEAPGILNVPKNLGTPGTRNSRYAANAGPSLTEIVHSPLLPAINQSVVVTARVSDSDGLASVQLVWRVDPFGTPVTTNMVDNGTSGDAVANDGVYSATIPGQADNALVAFYLQATDRYVPAATMRFPTDAPARECLVHFGEANPAGSYGSYRFWMTQATENKWVTNEKYSNEPYDGTVVYNNFRVIYNAASHYAGSPAHSKLYDSPTGTNCDYQILVPADDLLLDENSLRIQQPGLFGSDDTGQNEQIAFWMVGQFDVPTLHRRPVHMFVNGKKRFLIYEDTQRPSASFDQQWYPDSDVGDLFKIAYWYEYSNDTTSHGNTSPSLVPFTTTGGEKKLARYRQNFPKRAVHDSAHNYTNLYNLVDLLDTTLTGDAYAQRVFPSLDVREWCLTFAVERIINNTDLYGARRLKGDVTKAGGQNAFILKPAGDTWKFLCWDLDAAFLGTPVDPLFDFTDSPISNLFLHPFVLRTYWQALEDAANGPLTPGRLNATAQARYSAYQASGIPAAAPDGVLSFLATRRDYILQLISDVRAPFAITSNNGLDFTNAGTLATLAGLAPIQARRITVNGIEYPLSWSSITNWTVRLPLSGATNVFAIQGFDVNGNALSNYSRVITVYFNGPISPPEQSLVLNEIMFQPASSNAHYVELFNRSTNTTFDLWNYRLNGLSHHFHPGDIIAPQSYLILARDTAAFQAAYGTNLPVAGEFAGSLDPKGETLSLIREPLTTNETELTINKVKYETAPPWPAAPARTNSGVALQLIDPARDNARVSNWDDGTGWRFVNFFNVPNSSTATLFLWLDAVGEVLIDDLRVVLGTLPAVGSNYVRNGDFETALASPWVATSEASTSGITNYYPRSGTNSLRLRFTAAGSSSKHLSQALAGLSTVSNYTVSFWYRPVTNNLNLNIRLGGSSFILTTNMRPVTATPGAANWVAGTVNPYPLLWINEVQPNNPNGFLDNTATAQPWLELLNTSTNSLSLDGYTLSKNYTNLNQWAFPTGTVLLPGEFRVVFADGRPAFTSGTNLHTTLRLDPTNGALVLSKAGQLLDYINYTNMLPGVSRGSTPDGQLFDRQLFYFVTPGTTNNPSPVPVAINEWLASNTGTLLDPSTGTYEDWFELYNFGGVQVNLSGFYLTDDNNTPKKWRIPDGILMPPQSFLFCWADGDTTGTNLLGNALHTSFKLSKSGGEIALYSPDSIKVDKVSFGPQFNNVSQGKYPDGNAAGPNYSMPIVTPRTNNLVTNNLYAPVIAALTTSYTRDEGALLTFTPTATDFDLPVQTMAWSLTGTVPDGAAIDPGTGVFTWVPSEAHGGDSYTITIQVTDNGGPPLFDSETISVTVNEINSPPAINPVPTQTVNPVTPLNLTLTATDPDIPSQLLTLALVSGPAGSTVDAAGNFLWTPTLGQADSTNTIVVSVTDDGSPPQTNARPFTVIVNPAPLCSGLEGDVTGTNGQVTIADWVLVGRFAAGLNTNAMSDPTNINQCIFDKADCSPRPAGDCRITIADWVQAGRYAAGFDGSNFVGVCIPPAPFAPAGVLFAPASSRQICLTNLAIEQGQTNWIQIIFESQGDENGLQFSLSYDTNRLTYIRSRLGPDVNPDDLASFSANGATKGYVAYFLGLGIDLVFPGGRLVIIEVAFRAQPTTNPVSTALNFVDHPISREVVDPTPSVLPASYQSGSLVVTRSNSFLFEAITLPGPDQVQLQLIGEVGATWNLQHSADLSTWEPLATVTNLTGRLEYIHTTPSGAGQRFYRAVKP